MKKIFLACILLLAPQLAFAGSQSYDTPGTYTFTVPAYSDTLTVQVWGGGGGGASKTFGVVKGEDGDNSSWFNSVFGGGGKGGSDKGGAGGIASGGTTNTNGDFGGNPNGICGSGGSAANGGGDVRCEWRGSVPGGGGGGSANGAGGGGGGGYSSRTYAPGQLPGSVSITVGAGGAGGRSPNAAGGNGADGRICITWPDAALQPLSCSVTFDENPIPPGGSTIIHWSSTNAALFYINTIGYVGASGSAQVTASATTDYSGYVNDAADGTGTSVPCPAATLVVSDVQSDVQCPARYIKQGDQCVISDCPTGYILQGDECVSTSECTNTPMCSGSSVVDSCTGATISSCDWGCAAGACNPVPPPSATLTAVPSLVHFGDTTVVSWSSQNTDSCTVNGTNGNSWVGVPSSGQTTSPIIGQTIYSLHCVGYVGACSFHRRQANHCQYHSGLQ